MWSEETKQGLLRHHPGMLLVDAFSSSEAIGMGSSVSSAAGAAATARFTLGPEVRVIDDDGRGRRAPGRPVSWPSADGSRLGYYKDEAKTAATFRTIDGVRYSVPGDYAEVGEDGSIHLLGRGSVCINTGGEKVYPEEVEEVIKTVAGVVDAVVVGIPNERFGEEIVAVVEARPRHPGDGLDPGLVIAHVKSQAGRRTRPRVGSAWSKASGVRRPGKVDYARHRSETAEWAGPPPA